jgi:drug/metabolite transporter (DMT)-like permease
MISSIPYQGEVFSLLTAVIWAWGVILFKKSGETVHPIALNLFKNILASVLILPTMYAFGGTLDVPVSAQEYLLILASGALGIGIADTLFFKSLNLLGAGLSAVIDCLYSPCVIGLSVLWLGERLTFLQGIGVVMIVSAVLTAASRKGSRISPRNLRLGIIYGALAMAIMAVGIVIVKPLLDRLPVLWISEVRLAGGSITLGIILILHPGRRSILSSLAPGKDWKYLLSGSFLGTYLAFVLWLAGMKFTQVSVAAALNQTSNIFIFIFAAVFLHESISLQRVIGIFLGVAGTLLVTFS